ncbi:MAG TPA: sigma-70 family RNA polymerase sigma factor [Patescibacteria group bacterium]|nr:sigma-70 family RNA polymerase sigma factor [Patescibacteria group bacterium]
MSTRIEAFGGGLGGPVEFDLPFDQAAAYVPDGAPAEVTVVAGTLDDAITDQVMEPRSREPNTDDADPFAGDEEGEQPETRKEPEDPEDTEISVSTDLVRVYLQQIARTPLLNAEQEVMLSKRIEAGLRAEDLLGELDEHTVALWALRMRFGYKPPAGGRLVHDLLTVQRDGERAKNHLMEANLRLVVSIAKHYTGRGMAFLDLIQEGNTGLVRAVEKFDFTKGYKFSTYATWWIRQAITRGMANQARAVRVPVHFFEVMNRVRRVTAELERDLGRKPTPAEVTAEAKISPEVYEQVMEVERQEPVSLDMPVKGGKPGSVREAETTLGDIVAARPATAPREVEDRQTREVIEDVLATLTDREAGVMRRRHGFEDGRIWTLEELGEFYGVSRERIRQVERKTLLKLRNGRRGARLAELRD